MMRNRTNYYREYPPGAIQHMDDLMAIIIEARKEKKAIRLWTVQQSGYLSPLYIVSKTKRYKAGTPNPTSPNDISLHADIIYPVFRDFSSYGWSKRWHQSHEYPSQYGINSNFNVEHRVFTNKAMAERYSETLKNDRVYMEDVKNWHAECNRMFGGLEY